MAETSFSNLVALQSFLGLTWLRLLQPLPMPHSKRLKSDLNLWPLNFYQDEMSICRILLYVFSNCGPMDPEAMPDPHAPAGVGRLSAGPLAGEVAVIYPAGCKNPGPAPNTAPD